LVAIEQTPTSRLQDALELEAGEAIGWFVVVDDALLV
jgi:hypothetical protein